MNEHSKKKTHGVLLKKVQNGFRAIGSNPVIDWEIIFFISTFLIIAVMSYGTYIFYKVDKGLLNVVEEKSPGKIVTIDRTALRTIIEQFDLKKATYDDLRSQKIRYVDPSI